MNSSTTDLVLAPDAAIDLHLHTIHSDGSWLPEQLMEHLVSEQFGLAAIADHDRADTVNELQQLARDKHLPVLIAVEMSTMWRGEMTDVLCYGFDPHRPALNNVAQDLLRRQSENTREVYQKLQQQGHFPKDSGEDLAALLGKPSAEQPHALVALLKKTIGDTGGDPAGKIAWQAGCDLATTDIAAVVDAAHQSGAVALIAHPGRDDGFVTYNVDLLDQLRQEVPIDGLEVYYPLHTPAQVAMYLDYARKHNLLISSGSDSHNTNKKPIKYRADLSRNLLERVGIQIKE